MLDYFSLKAYATLFSRMFETVSNQTNMSLLLLEQLRGKVFSLCAVISQVSVSQENNHKRCNDHVGIVARKVSRYVQNKSTKAL